MTWNEIQDHNFSQLGESDVCAILSDINKLPDPLTSYATFSRCRVILGQLLRRISKLSLSEEKENALKLEIEKAKERLCASIGPVHLRIQYLNVNELEKLWISELAYLIDDLESLLEEMHTTPESTGQYEYAESGQIIVCEIERVLKKKSLDSAGERLMHRALLLHIEFMGMINSTMTEWNLRAQQERVGELEEQLKDIANLIDRQKEEAGSLKQLIQDQNEKATQLDQRIESNKTAVKGALRSSRNLLNQLIKKEIDAQKQRIEDSEHNMLSHVLSLMGVFSAITVIITGLTISATSWLNGLDIATATVAFALPSLIAVMATAILLSLVFFYLSKPGKKLIWGIVGTSTLILLLCFVCFAWNSASSEPPVPETNPDHSLYIIEQFAVDEASSMVAFQFQGENRLLPMEPEHLHPDGLYFCEIHNALE